MKIDIGGAFLLLFDNCAVKAILAEAKAEGIFLIVVFENCPAACAQQMLRPWVLIVMMHN